MGRDREIGLRAVVDDLVSGRGRVVAPRRARGHRQDPPVGELRSILPEGVTWLEGHCLSYGGLPIWPFKEMLRRWLGVDDEEPEIATRTKARARLGALLGSGLDDALAPLGRLLRVRLDPDVATEAGRDESPEAVRHAFCAWIEALARSRPVVVAVEDLHWAFPDARELAESLLELTDRAAVLLVATLRLDSGSEAWRFRLRALGDYAHRTVELRLGPLSTADAGQLVHDRAAGPSTHRRSRRSCPGPRETRCSSRSSCGSCSRGRASSGDARGR